MNADRTGFLNLDDIAEDIHQQSGQDDANLDALATVLNQESFQPYEELERPERQTNMNIAGSFLIPKKRIAKKGINLKSLDITQDIPESNIKDDQDYEGLFDEMFLTKKKTKKVSFSNTQVNDLMKQFEVASKKQHREQLKDELIEQYVTPNKAKLNEPHGLKEMVQMYHSAVAEQQEASRKRYHYLNLILTQVGNM